MKETAFKKEWKLLSKKEQKLIQKYEKESASFLNQALEDIVPKGLNEKLDTAFIKAFSIIFEHGTEFIEKTYQKEKYEKDFEVQKYAHSVYSNRKSLKVFQKKSSQSQHKNLLLSSAEGIGLGLLGIGIVDIPLFTAVLLKSIYEIALSYGFTYDAEAERYFILQLIEISVRRGKLFKEENTWVNEWIDSASNGVLQYGETKIQIEKTAKALSRELLYLKFLQGIPIVGIIGGISDSIYLKKISDYATLKYYRRFLLTHIDHSEKINGKLT